MAGSVNKVILVGNLGRDPEVRRMNNGEAVVSFGLATTESWRDKASGERKERTEWHNVVIFNENRSFDHEYGTFPGVDGLYSDGKAPRSAAAGNLRNRNGRSEAPRASAP